MKKQNRTKGWTPEKRKKAAERCRKHAPSQYSTGPRTPKGKATIRKNALKHGLRSTEIDELMKVLRQQHALVKTILRSTKSPKNASKDVQQQHCDE